MTFIKGQAAPLGFSSKSSNPSYSSAYYTPKPTYMVRLYDEDNNLVMYATAKVYGPLKEGHNKIALEFQATSSTSLTPTYKLARAVVEVYSGYINLDESWSFPITNALSSIERDGYGQDRFTYTLLIEYSQGWRHEILDG